MKSIYSTIISALLPAALLLGGCDEGRIYPDEGEGDRVGGGSADVTATLTADADWPEGYALSLAGFADGADYACIVKNLAPDTEGKISATLEGIPDDARSIELCVTDRLRRRVRSFASAEFTPGKKVRLEAGEIDAKMGTAVESEIFATTCANCHGGSGHSAAGLNLTAGHALGATVGVESTVEPGMLRIKPGDAEESLLYRILTTGESKTWHYDHSVEVIDPVRQNLLRDWINNL